MGYAKELLATLDHQLHVGTGIAVEAGLLERCEAHPECCWETYEDVEEGHNLAQALLAGQDARVEGMTLDDLKTAIESALINAGSGEGGCPICTKNMESAP